MILGQVEEMLREYKRSTGRAGYLEVVITTLGENIRERIQEFRESITDGIGAPRLDGMPRASTVGNPTERIGLMLASNYTPEELKNAQEELKKAENELKRVQIVIMFVEAWMKGLTNRERWIIERIYFDEKTYNETVQLYEEEFGITISKEGVRNLKREALQKIMAMAE